MSENLEIKIDLKLDDEKAQSQMTQALASLKDLANNKANNIDIRVNVDKGSLADLAKIESAVKEINKLSKDAQKSLFNSKSGTLNNNAVKEQQKELQKQRKEQEKMYSQMFKDMERQEKQANAIKKQQAKEQAQADKQRLREQAQEQANRLKENEAREKESLKAKEQRLKEQEQMYKNMFDTMARQEADQQKVQERAQKDKQKSFNNINKDILKAQGQVEKLGKSGFVDMSELEKVKSALLEVSNIHVWDNIDNLDLSQSRGEIDRILDSLKQIDDVRLEGLNNAKVENFTSKMTSDLDALETKFKELGRSTEGIDRLRAELQGLDSVAPDRLPSTFQRMRQEVSQLNGEIRQTSASTRGMSGFLGDISDSMRTFTLGNMIGDGIVTSIRAVTRSFLEMDSAMTNVKKVAQNADIDSNLELDNIKGQAIDIAKEVGMASTDVINGISASLQAGMGSMEQSIAVARSSLMLANVGDMAQAQASSAVSTMVKGFKIDPLKEVKKEMNGTVVVTNELTESMDILNHAGNNYAIGTDGVAEALKRGGSVLSEYGVSLSDSVALITSANEAVQNPEKVGNGMKSIAINLAGMKTSAKDGTLELNKTAKALSEIAGVDVYEDKKTGKVKDMVKILDEVQKKWKGLREDEKLGLSEAIAGKYTEFIL